MVLSNMEPANQKQTAVTAKERIWLLVTLQKNAISTKETTG